MIRLLILLAVSQLFVMSCTSQDDFSAPAVPVRVKTLEPIQGEGWKEAPKSKTYQETVVSKPKKSLAGKVTFSGMNSAQLEEFRIIPEQGSAMLSPAIQRYEQVDGFWWEGDQNRWFKIPDHGEAWVVGKSGKAPEHYDGSSENDGFQVYWKSIPAFRWASAMKGGVSEPGWYPNSGKSRIGVGYPF